MPEEDRATAMCDLHKKFCEDRFSDARDMLTDRQTHRQTNCETDRNTLLPYRGGVTRSVWLTLLVEIARQKVGVNRHFKASWASRPWDACYLFLIAYCVFSFFSFKCLGVCMCCFGVINKYVSTWIMKTTIRWSLWTYLSVIHLPARQWSGEAEYRFVPVPPCVCLCPHNNWNTTDQKSMLLGWNLHYGDQTSVTFTFTANMGWLRS